MGKYVCNGAITQCSFGLAPGALNIVAPMAPKIGGQAMATIADMLPLNIGTFGMCQTPSNPAVAAATAAASGVLTPAPCTPIVAAPWAPASQVMVCGKPALLNNGKCACAYGGVISINMPGNLMVDG